MLPGRRLWGFVGSSQSVVFVYMSIDFFLWFWLLFLCASDLMIRHGWGVFDAFVGLLIRTGILGWASFTQLFGITADSLNTLNDGTILLITNGKNTNSKPIYPKTSSNQVLTRSGSTTVPRSVSSKNSLPSNFSGR